MIKNKDTSGRGKWIPGKNEPAFWSQFVVSIEDR